MLKIIINKNEYSVKQEAKDFTLGEYENLSAILNNDKSNEIERFYDAFILLGIEEDVLDTFDGFTFIKLIKEFKNYEMKLGDYTKVVEINGRTYQSYKGDEFFFTVKDMKLIEKYVKQNPTHFIGEIMSIIFKDVELTKNEHYDNAHIKHKAKIFREHITYDVALPFITSFSKNLIESLESFKKTIII